MRSSIYAFVLTLLIAQGAAGQPAYRVIVHPDNPVDALSSRKISDLFLKKTLRWENGTVAEAVDLPENSAVREAFSMDVHGRDPSRIAHYWQRKIFSGEDLPPAKRADDAEVMSFVRDRPGAIGYVAARARLEGVKALDVVTLPKAVSRVAPRYTPAARELRIQGVVMLAVTVGVNGRVTDVEVKRRLKGGLSQEAVQAVRRWHFEPAVRNGQKVEWVLDVPIRFEFDEDGR